MAMAHFAFAGVIPGLSYQITVTAENFDSWQSQPFPVRAGDQLSYTDIRLKVGATDRGGDRGSAD